MQIQPIKRKMQLIKDVIVYLLTIYLLINRSKKKIEEVKVLCCYI